jgi:Recombinase
MKKISACPSWLDLSEDRGSFVFVPEKAQIVREIFGLSIGGLGSYAIADRLNRKGVPPFGPSPTWDHATIDGMLRSRATVGEYQPKSWAGGTKKGVPVGAPISKYYPAVVDETAFQVAQVARQRHLATGRGRKGNNIANLFTDLTTCAYCGGPVKFHSNGDSKSLICAQVIENVGCIRAAWTYRNFESSVLSFLAHPALMDRSVGDGQKLLAELAFRIKQLHRPETYDLRLEIASLAKQVISELKVASAGADPTPTLPGALVRRDNPERFFEITLSDGRGYRGMPVL